MNIYLLLFLTFLELGAVSFGGGYGMISMLREKCLVNGWVTEDQFLNLLAVSESTPGPIAINMATFIGSKCGGILGSLLATLGVVLPSFIIILLIAIALKRLMKYGGVNAFIVGVRPVVVGLILATGIIMFLSNILGITNIENGIVFNYKGLIIFGIVALIYILYKIIRKKEMSAIILILVSAILGMILFRE